MSIIQWRWRGSNSRPLGYETRPLPCHHMQHVMRHDITQQDTCMLVCMYIMTNKTTVTSSGYTHPRDLGIHQWYRYVTNRVVHQYCPHGITLPGKIPRFFPDILGSFSNSLNFPRYLNQIFKFPDFFYCFPEPVGRGHPDFVWFSVRDGFLPSLSWKPHKRHFLPSIYFKMH